LSEDARPDFGGRAALGAVAHAETPTTWAYAAKTGVGASYEAYVDGAYKDGGATGAVSKVWFSIADGTLTETMYGLIHEAQIKQLRVAVKTSTGLAVEGADTTSARPNTCTSTPPAGRCRRPTR
jgi:glucoamylase